MGAVSAQAISDGFPNRVAGIGTVLKSLRKDKFENH